MLNIIAEKKTLLSLIDMKLVNCGAEGGVGLGGRGGGGVVDYSAKDTWGIL